MGKNKIIKIYQRFKDGRCILSIMAFFFFLFFASILPAFAENIDIRFSYGIDNVAKPGRALPFELTVTNSGSQSFKGYIDLNVYETNNSVYTYRSEISLDEHSTMVKTMDVTLSNTLNTVSISVYNERNELVEESRSNIDLRYYSNKLIVGALTSDFNILTYLDSVIVTDTGIETKLVDVGNADRVNDKYFDLLDMLLISNFDFTELNDNSLYSIEKFIESGRPVIVAGDLSLTEDNPLYNFLNGIYDDGKNINDSDGNFYYRLVNTNKMIVFMVPISFVNTDSVYDNRNLLMDILGTSTILSYINRIIDNDNLFISNDYYSIRRLLNVVDDENLPKIFPITVYIIAYLFFIILVLYVLLRNLSKQRIYGVCVFIVSTLVTIWIFYSRFSSLTKNITLSYISIVDIKDANTSEKAFLNFLTNESGDFRFDTESTKEIYPILRSTREPIRSINFIDSASIKEAVFTKEAGKTVVSVNNAKSFDSNLFAYENNNYLNDIYNINCSFERFDGSVTGRVTNNMRIPIHDAKILLYGKVIDIGDITPTYSLSLSRGNVINTPINNNEMLADILSNDSNKDIIKYYLDQNIHGYFDYALFLGFIDNNGTIDINSSSVGDVRGKTLLVTKVSDDMTMGIKDLCSLQNDVENVNGYYDEINNSIKGDEAVVNTYRFDKDAALSKIYFEGIDSYDYGSISTNVPFYGDIYAYNLDTLEYDLITDNRILYDSFEKYLTYDNQLTLRFVPTSRDPIYRMISLPVVRAIATD